MEREQIKELIRWRDKDPHLPILLRGARQVGKTTMVQVFGREYFENFVEVNFELNPEFCSCFETLHPKEIISRIEVMANSSIKSGSTLLFLDEIQACPKAIVALRYFKELMPDLHVIAAGSLLEFALSNEEVSMPVGRIQYLYLKPLSFREFLYAKGLTKMLEYISNIELSAIIPSGIHNELLALVKEYMNIGGMPMVVHQYLSEGSMQDCQNYQTLLLRTFVDDFNKYARKVRHKYLQKVFDKAPGLVGHQIKYSKISSDMQSVYLKDAISDLHNAGVVTPIYSTSGAGIPLNTYINEKKFKMIFLDVGLVKRATKIDMELLFAEDLMLLNQGAIAEQFVGQELLAYQDPYDEASLFYWAREQKGSTAEVDYVISVDEDIIPLEVKAGKTGSLRSLQLFMNTHQSKIGLRVSTKEFGMRHNIISIPFYLISELPRLVKSYLTKL